MVGCWLVWLAVGGCCGCLVVGGLLVGWWLAVDVCGWSMAVAGVWTIKIVYLAKYL